MAEFLKGNHLNSKLDVILEEAKEKLFLISPFIKFHSRVKEVLNTKKLIDGLQIVVVFGKNEHKKEKSFSKEDFDYLSGFPNVIIKYEPRLHAKYYANESATLLSSMNLYEYSQNNNIEFGIYSKANGVINNLLGSESLDKEAWEYFKNVVENAETIFRKVPIYEAKLMGLSKRYVRSEVEVDKSDVIFVGNRNKKMEKPKPTSKQKGNLLSATALGKLKEKNFKHVVSCMENEGFIKNDDITFSGKKEGLQLKSNAKGDSWIVYPESLKDIL